MKKVEIEIYNYDELEEAIKEKLLKDEMEAQHEYYLETYLYDDLKEKALSLIEEEYKDSIFKLRDKDIKLYYDLSYSQGSGAMIEYDLIDNHYNTIKIKHSGFYYHQFSFELEYYESIDEEALREKIIRINNKLTKYGYDLIEQELDKEEALIYLREFEYYKNGQIFE